MKISMYMNRFDVINEGIESGYAPRKITLAQIYALYNFANWQRKDIANLLEYAPSTVSTMKSKAQNNDEVIKIAEILFWEEPTEEIIETAIEEAIEEETKILYRRFRDNHPDVPMEFMPKCGKNLKNEQAVYFFKFYSETELLFNKIGTTAKDVVGRLRDEIGDYSKKFDIRRVEIHRIRSCGAIPAEGAESALRAELISRYPTAFRKNDRFFNVDIAPSVFDEIISKYFG